MVNRVSFCSLQTHLITNPSPLALSKAIKNEVEIEGMKQAHVSNIYMRYWPNGRLRWLHTGQVNFCFCFFFFCVVLDQDEVEVTKNAKKSEAILTNQTWSIKNLSCIWSKRELFLRDQCGKSRTDARWSLLARSVSQSIFLPDRRFSHMINIDSILLLLHVLYSLRVYKILCIQTNERQSYKHKPQIFLFFPEQARLHQWGIKTKVSSSTPSPKWPAHRTCSQLCYW